MSGLAAAFASTTSDRVVWLDGAGSARPWAGEGSLLGVLGPHDVSLTFDATQRVVRRHQSGESVAVGDDIFAVLEEEVAREGDDPSVVWAGYLGYACRTDLPGRPADPLAGVPDAVWLRVPPTGLRTSRDEVVDPPKGGHPGTAPPEDRARPDAAYARAFGEVQRQLRMGNSYEVNLTYRERVLSASDPAAAYLRLRALNPAPYSGYLRHGDVHLLSSSPERYAAVTADRTLEARPIKGTTPRGGTAAEDAEHRRRLETDARFRAESLMVVDLLRNDLSMVCDPGTVTVPELMTVESYPSVHQLVSTVRGSLRDGVSTVVALRALFPAGSMTGAPKRRTMEVIDAVEATPRGAYAGAFGWIRGDGRADLSVVIRTLAATPTSEATGPGGWVYELGTGGGITVRSTVEEEYAETRWKAARLLAAVTPSTG